VTVYEKHIPQWKLEEVEKLAAMIKASQMIGLVNVEGVGSKQLQGIRDSLRESAVIRMARNTLMIRALEEAKKKGLKHLVDYVKGPVSFIFSDQDPFVLSNFLRENKAAAPAKGGQTAPKDIIVPAMNTGVAPGPFISELAGLKIPSRVKGGVIHITEDTVAVEEGGIISNAMAQMLGRLGIEPMELQLKLIAAYTDGTVLTAENFDIDLKDILDEFILGHQFAVNLSINTVYPTEDTVPIILAKANVEAKSLTLNVGYFVPEILGEFIAKANSEAYALVAHLSEKNPEAIPSEILSQIGQVSASVSAPAESETAETPAEETEDEEDEEDEAVTGLGGLFG
jgi:large subunit ribosomal protein L10